MFQLLLRNLRLAHQANRFYVTALVVANMIIAALELATFLILAKLIDLFVDYIRAGDAGISNEVWWWFGALVVRWVLANATVHFLDYLAEVHKPQVLDYTDNIIIAKLDCLPTEVIESSDFQDRMTNIHTFSKLKFVENLDLLGKLVQSAAQFVYAIIALLLSNPLIAVLIVVVSLPEAYYNLRIIRKMRDLNVELALERRRRNYFVSLTQDVSQYFALKSYNLFPLFLERAKSAQAAIIEGTKKILRYHKPRSVVIGMAANLLGQFLPKGYYVWSTLNGHITIGQFQLYFRLIDAAYSSSYWLCRTYLEISENNVYVKDLFDLLDMPNEQKGVPAKVDLSTVELEFRDVSFTYPESDRPVLQHVNFKVRNGEKLAIVGHNGAGKTTITRLINKFYEPTEGVILVNGVDLRAIDDLAWRKAISNLAQEVSRFFLPLKDNVLLGDYGQTIDRQRYQNSIQEAMLEKDIQKLPKKGQTMLGKFFPEGVNFSGGQWQKLSIARSFYRRAPLLVLDEPTSAIDSKAEQKIFESIFERSSGQAQIIISHKFSNIRQADKIIVMAEGRVIEEGTHRSLIAMDGEYAQLYSQQAAAFAE